MATPTPPKTIPPQAPDLAALAARLAQADGAARARLQGQLDQAQHLRRHQLAAIHLAAQALDLDEHSYRAGVARVSGGRVSSAAGLSRREREALLAEYRHGGWQPPARRVRQRTAARFKEATSAKVRALLLDAGRGDAYANAIAVNRFGVARWEWLDGDALHKLMQMLIIDARRREDRP